ncbi:uncharacterized protein LOC113514899, partial [Galleria mellonella]|uniref:Uncharacterized protein LOC113514899 n=1 Tax=Galleria mellonella TaxID=7137 RepID=A0ABM3MI07_GALME
MIRFVLLMAMLTRAIAPQNVTEVHGTELATPPTSLTMPPPTVFRNTRITSKPRRQMKHGKGDSPMLNYIFDSYATSNKHFHDKFKPPSFEGEESDDTILDADTGSTVIFDCKVTSLRDKMVSWLRVSDEENLELLTLDLDTHTADYRYRMDVAGDNWRLSLSDAKVQDSGIYCCHVSTHPPMIRRFKLIVHPPEIRMSKEAFLESGETLSLKCSILHLHPGDIVPEMHWYRGNSTVSLDEVRGGVLVETDHLTLTSHLQ